jgi:GMP synthase (glutamine-hydrolysing)
MSRPILIVQTGTALERVRRRRGDYPHWFRSTMRLPRERVVVVDARAEAGLPDARAYAGVVLTGSASMVSEREPWSERTAEWLRGVVDHGTPVLGVCYGHQLLAHALGGRVDYNPLGREIGTVEVELGDAASADPLFRGLGDRMLAQATHRQSVLEPPPGGEILGRTALDPCSAFRVNAHAWGIQFHPEFSVATLAAYIAERRDAIRHEGGDPGALTAALRPAPASRRVLTRFARLALARD